MSVPSEPEEGAGLGPSASRATRVLALAEELLRIDSVIGDEGRICDHIEARIDRLRPHAVVRASNSLCIEPRAPRPGAKTVLLVGHVDTVPALSPNPVRREGVRLHGLGASDMKAADAVLLDVLERAIHDEPRHDVVGVLYAREEGPYAENEMELIAAAAESAFQRADLAICMEPTDGQIELGCLGTSHATLRFRGRRAHSARPWQGENAIHHAGDLLVRLAACEPQSFRFGALEFIESMSAVGVAFRGARNVVPDLCTVDVNYRFAPGRNLADVHAAFAALLAGKGEFEVTDFCPAGHVCGDSPLLRELQEAAGDPPVAAKQAWTDVGRLSAMGIDAINWGPGAKAQAHRAGEWVDTRDVVRAAEVLGNWLFGDGRPMRDENGEVLV
ncbi:MAG: succinyl-diaminopimelate desuccinylase [Planctomycetota bacterium]|jgi:succinyl-diaminopimelate desuccinylase